MVKRSLLLCLMALLLVPPLVKAEVQVDYTESFSGVDTGIVGFHPKGWEHKFYGTYYKATYTLVEDDADGVYLQVKQYNANIPAYDDYLITPAVSGKVSLKVKLCADGGSMKFYRITEGSNGSLSKGEELVPDVSPDLGEAFSEVAFSNLAEPVRIGICGDNVGFKDFYAQSADVVLKTKLVLTSVKVVSTEPAYVMSGYNKAVNLPENNRYSVTFSVTLSNEGETPLNADTPGYTLTANVGGKEIATVPIRTALADGESVTEEYTFADIDGSGLSGSVQHKLSENVSGSSDYENLLMTAWHAEFAMREAETTSTWYDVKSGATVDFGSVSGRATERYWIYNNGTAPLTLDVTVPEGFESSVVTGTVVDGGTHIPVDISILGEPCGSKSGTLVIKGNDMADFSLTLTGKVLDPSLWFTSFNDGKLPADMVTEGSGWTFSADGYAQIGSTDGARITTPKLSVAEGEVLEAKVRKYGSSYYKPVFKVFKSADRKDWQLVAEHGEDEIITDWVTIPVSGIEPGDWYIAFECANLRIDDLYGFRKAVVAHDVVVVASDFPAAGEVNTGYTATVTLRNVGPELAAGSYKAALYVAGSEVALAADAPALAEGAVATLTFCYTPHAAGEALPVEVKLVSLVDGSIVAQTGESLLSVAEEVMKGDIVVGTMTSTKNNRSVVYGSSAYSWSDIIYPSDKLMLDAGAKITRIAFKADITSSGLKGEVSAWLENTELTAVPGKWSAPESDATVQMSWDFPVVKGEEALVLDLSDAPFVYTGGGLRLRVKTQMTSKGNITWYVDNSAGKSKYDYESYDAETPTMYDAQTPVAFLSVAADPVVVGGKVTDAVSGDAIAGVKITVKSGDVEYYAVSDADGVYSVTLMKVIDGYSVNAVAQGYFRYSAPVELLSEAVSHDIAMQPAEGLYIKSQSIPSVATVNHECAVVATVQNVDATPFADGSYSVNLYVGNELVATQDGVMLAGNDDALGNPDAEHQFVLSFVPHAPVVEPVMAYLSVTWGDAGLFTGTASPLTVGEEVAGGEAVTGTPSGFDSKAPVRTFYNASVSHTVYSAGRLGIPEGADLTRIVYKGYNNNTNKTFVSDIKVWMQNTSDAEDATAVYTTDDMTLVYDGSVEFTGKGSASEPADLLDLAFSAPFRYEGENLRVVVKALTANGSTVNFEIDETGVSYMKSDMDEAKCDAATAQLVDMPVAHIMFANQVDFTGIVQDAETLQPVAGASVELTSGNVLYRGETDSDGSFNIVVVQRTRSYSIEVAAGGYMPYTAADVDLMQHQAIELVKAIPSGVDAVELPEAIADDDAPVYDTAGRRVTKSHKGVLIQPGHKFVNK